MNSIKKSSELVSSKFLVKSPISNVNEVVYTVWTASACLHCFYEQIKQQMLLAKLS